MAELEVDVQELVRDVDLQSVALRVTVWVAVVTALAMVLLGQATSDIAYLDGWRIAAGFVLLAFIGVTAHLLRNADTRSPTPGRPWWRQRWFVEYALFLVATVVLLEVLFRSATPGLVLDAYRGQVLFAIFLFIMVIAIVPGYDRFTPDQWFVVACFALLAMTFLSHTLAVYPSGTASRWPIWAVVVAAVALLVVPRIVPAEVTLWAIAILASIAAVLGFRSVDVGEYTIGPIEVGIWSGPQGLFAWTGVPQIQSIFPNINLFGLVAFAGLVSAIVLMHSYATGRVTAGVLVAASLAILNGLALIFSHSRASWLAATVAIVVFAGYVGLGREYLPIVTVAILTLVGVAMAAVLAGYIPIVSTWYELYWRSALEGRIGLWRASIDAFRANPSYFGAGIIDTEAYIEPYLVDQGPSDPHNSYLSILLRTGYVGFVAYLGIILGSIASGITRVRTVDVGMLALALGWAVHMLFEEYTILQWTPPAVLAALAFGYVVFGHRAPEGIDEATVAEESIDSD